jgi:hypothetical protein
MKSPLQSSSVRSTVLILLTIFFCYPSSPDAQLRIDPQKNEVRVPVVAHPEHFQGFLPRWFGMPGYHLLVWDKGAAARNALFTTSVSDTDLLEAFSSLGAHAGKSLPMTTWEARHESDHPAPDLKTEGPSVDIAFQWPESDGPLPITSLLEDPGGRGLDFRFSGNAENISVWKSGCGICLYSCPGGKIGNAAYTVRDYVKGLTRFRTTRRFPQEGTEGTLIIRLLTRVNESEVGAG